MSIAIWREWWQLKPFRCCGPGGELIFQNQRLVEARKYYGITQQVLADTIGLLRPQLALIERGRAQPSVRTLHNLCGALQCRADWLLGLTDDSGLPPEGQCKPPFRR